MDNGPRIEYLALTMRLRNVSIGLWYLTFRKSVSNRTGDSPVASIDARRIDGKTTNLASGISSDNSLDHDCSKLARGYWENPFTH